ncbi:hypothetical protein UFOVP787_124 [uncultured Caudovirales phage]|uniref:Uncharacterized protein n=1 Tax=uncultured Caudovirales phage TaxID=2100421 RepID=A0A6J5NYL6_9CAUD|nr:hypothetical protein UFOVP787_124 [uncultured Caudovirales phage]
MTINVVVAKKRTIRVSSNGTAGVINTTAPVTIKPTPTLSSLGASTRLDQLTDVDASNEVDGATLVYDDQNDKYVVQYLDLADTTGTLDGGSF